MDLVSSVARRFGAGQVEEITHGRSGASVHRLTSARGSVLFLKQGSEPEVSAEVDRLTWLDSVGFGAPKVVDAESGWMLTSELSGRDVAQPWGSDVRGRVLDAFADALLALHSLDASLCPFSSRYPVSALTTRPVVTHGDFCCPNVLIDPETLTFTGVLDVGWLGVADAYVDVATTVMTLGELNPQYGGAAAAERVLRRMGADPEDPRITEYLAFYRA